MPTTYDAFTAVDETFPVYIGDDNWGRKLNQKLNQFFDGMIGTLRMSASSILPEGWLKCDGSAISRTAYPKLFARIGTTYGPGNGTTTFNLPNFTDKFPTQGTLGSTGGNNTVSLAHTHTLSVSIPTHTHTVTVTVPNHTHTISISGLYDARQGFGSDPISDIQGRFWGIGGTNLGDILSGTTVGESGSGTGTTQSSGSTSASGTAAGSGTLTGTGTSGPMSDNETITVKNPYLSVNFIIFYDWVF